MTEPKDPPRLADASASAPEGLRNLLGAAQNDLGSDAQLARLAERLGPLLAPPVVPVPPAAVAAGMGVAVKLGLVSVALCVAGGGAWLFTRHEPGPAPAPRVDSAAPATAAALSPVAPTAPMADAPLPAVSLPEPPGAQKPPAKPVPSAQVSEAELLEQARGALRSDPARALARANEHRSRFPRGVLVQEREVIAIKALRQLGRGAEADQRADAFERAFPGSAFQRKLKPSQ